MRNYRYIARDTRGVRREGFTQAISSNDVLGWLRDQGCTPISVNEITVSSEMARTKSHRGRIKSADLAALSWQLTTMLEGGIPLITALDTTAEDIEQVGLRKVLEDISSKIKRGTPFSECAAEYPRVFNDLCCALILAGETSGNLAAALRKLAEYFENRDKIIKKVKGAVAYPIFVFGFIVLIVIFIMAFIIPRFRIIFKQIGGNLPAFTRGFMAFYDTVRFNLHYISGGVILFVIALILFNKTKTGHYLFSRLVLRIPLFGKLFQQLFLVTFCRTMATLLAAGVSVLEVLDILAGLSGNDVIKAAVVRTKQQIVEGLNISLSVAASGFFPNMVVKMIQVGEESGSMPMVLERTADHYERKIEAMITAMMALLEPVMIITVGAIVLVVVLALYLPIFTMSDMAK
ncbi:MAG: type II secretion system F family protein [Sedimentisphaerales bacterium]|nr:type II secretion system F family protein [Sedimentisphaerales bacterium]